ncbi:hypothetical protein BDV96DRAFT_640366 [Lophiotrema nucula]|uniref:Uncharacterized protein n=1 Tax=Lophiotrema nucula TaxID=690887 RepID=A0A6A5ZU38_9PLEO|nr:hypothetical protein BDV96DRAFT_640366 [Lophiotrema nucula]
MTGHITMQAILELADSPAGLAAHRTILARDRERKAIADELFIASNPPTMHIFTTEWEALQDIFSTISDPKEHSQATSLLDRLILRVPDKSVGDWEKLFRVYLTAEDKENLLTLANKYKEEIEGRKDVYERELPRLMEIWESRGNELRGERLNALSGRDVQMIIYWARRAGCMARI